MTRKNVPQECAAKKGPTSRPAPDVAQIQPQLEIKPNRQLRNTVPSDIAGGGKFLSESAPDVGKIPIGGLEVGMIQQIEEVRIKSEPHPFIDLERFADAKINVREPRAGNRTPTEVGIAPKATMVVNRGIRQAGG